MGLPVSVPAMQTDPGGMVELVEEVEEEEVVVDDVGGADVVEEVVVVPLRTQI